MKVAHLAINPLSGSPVRIARALNEHTPVEASLVTLKPGIGGRQLFNCGLAWNEQQEEALESIREADCLHLHNFNEIGRFEELDKLLPEMAQKPKIVQFHSCPQHIHYQRNKSIPELVIAQYPERYYLGARVVPNLVGIDDPQYRPFEDKAPASAGMRVFFAPSMPFSAWKTPQQLGRWATKGGADVLARLRRLEVTSNGRMSCVYRTQVPHDQCMRDKQGCHIALDDVVTGSYHLASLESLSQGLVSLAYLDERTQRVLKDLTGAGTLPWVNCRLEELEDVLNRMLLDPGRMQAIGAQSRTWMKQYYNDASLVCHYERAYTDLLEDPSRILRKVVDDGSKKAFWYLKGQGNARYNARIPRGRKPLCEADIVEFGEEAFGKKHGFSNPVDAWFYEERGRRLDGDAAFFSSARREAVAKKYSFAASFIEGKKVLHLGCGTAAGTVLLKHEGKPKSVHGMDNDKLAVAYGKLLKRNEKVLLSCGDALATGLEAESFDAIVAINLVEQVDSDGTLIEECRRLLRPGGMLVLSCGDFWSEAMEHWQLRSYGRRSVERLLKGCFNCVDFYRHGSGSRGCVPALDFSHNVLKEGEGLIAVCHR